MKTAFVSSEGYLRATSTVVGTDTVKPNIPLAFQKAGMYFVCCGAPETSHFTKMRPTQTAGILRAQRERPDEFPQRFARSSVAQICE